MSDLIAWALAVVAFIGIIATLVAMLAGTPLAALICGAITIVAGFGMFAASAA